MRNEYDFNESKKLKEILKEKYLNKDKGINNTYFTENVKTGEMVVYMNQETISNLRVYNSECLFDEKTCCLYFQGMKVIIDSRLSKGKIIIADSEKIYEKGIILQ